MGTACRGLDLDEDVVETDRQLVRRLRRDPADRRGERGVLGHRVHQEWVGELHVEVLGGQADTNLPECAGRGRLAMRIDPDLVVRGRVRIRVRF